MIATRLEGLASLLPPGVAAVGMQHEGEIATMAPEEALYVRDAGYVRRAEFAAGRWCARHALKALGLPADPIGRRPDGIAAWPRGIVGSITHSHGYAVAAAASDVHFRALGIDAEPHIAAADDVIARIAAPAERQHLSAMSLACPDVRWGRVLFSAKEAAYKAWYPLMRTPLRFRDISVSFTTEGEFTAQIFPRFTSEYSTYSWTGRWACSEFVLTAVAVPAMQN